MSRAIDMVGFKFNGCEVLSRKGSSKDKKATWVCECSCGKTFEAVGKSIRNGTTKSCGCLKTENIKRVGKLNRTHGESRTRLYRIWRGIKKRCRLETDKQFKDYGGRGIDVADSWFNSFETFREWSMDNGYSENLTIDRIDNDLGYYPENCRWVGYEIQANNRRGNKVEEFEGELLTQSQIAKRVGISKELLHYRKVHGIPYNSPKNKRKGDD